MSDDLRLLFVPCGCDCQPKTLDAAEAENEVAWARCDCALCGDGRCGVRIDDCVKFSWLVGESPNHRGIVEPALITMADKKNSGQSAALKRRKEL